MQSPFEQTKQGLCLSITMNTPLGLHARPAAKLAQELQNFNAEVSVHYGDNKADAKSVVDMLTLGVINGSELFFYATGDDAKTCLMCIADFFHSLEH